MTTARKFEAPPVLPQATGPTDVIPAPPLRRWSKPVGFLFFLWGITAASAHSVYMVTIAFIVQGLRLQKALWWTTLTWASGILAAIRVKVDTRFEAPLPDGPCIFVCNHQSAIDILALFGALPRRFVFVAKKQVFSYPFIGWHISAAGYIKIDRTNRESAIRSLEVAGERIRGGLSVCIFPEGTRSKDGSILPFKKGPFMVALQSGVPIVPVAIEGALHVTPKNAWYVCPNTVRILVGPAFKTEGLTEADRDDLIRNVRSTLIRMHRRIGGLGGDERNAIAATGVEGIGRSIDDGP